MKVIARKVDAEIFLVQDDDASKAQVLDMEQERLFPPFDLQSILARGYWENYSMSEDRLNELIGTAE